MKYPPVVSCYDRFELVLPGPAKENPFTEVELSVQFENGTRILKAEGFYDGEGIYRARLMPDEPGDWQFMTHSNQAELDGKAGYFTCTGPAAGVHGPVQVAHQFHFAYKDGTPYIQTGTTCYAWVHQGEERERQTLAALSQAPFNKIRMCVFPKHYRYNSNEPELYPYERTPESDWDFNHFNPAFFRHIEQRVDDLGKLGIEADIILFHPYDRWGFSTMGRAADDLYLRYITARLSSYRNVWWSLANEYDLLKSKTEEDWDHYFQLLQDLDPHGHLRSIHNWQSLDMHGSGTFYDHRKPWVTHCSIQHGHVDLVTEWREQFGKPVIVDECCYEGNLPNGWGNITGQEMVRRFWECVVRGGYAGHGETFLDPEDVIWWSKGGTLHGESPRRIAFLREILESFQEGGLTLLGRISDTNLPSAGQPGAIYLTYFGFRQPGQMTMMLKEEGKYSVEVLDTWEMTITPVPGSFEGTFTILLPTKPYLAVLVRRLVEKKD